MTQLQLLKTPISTEPVQSSLTLSLPHSTVYPCEVVLTLTWCTKSYSVTIQIETTLEVLSHDIKSICFFGILYLQN